MKSSKRVSSSTQRKHACKKSGYKASSNKLDRKSSRGMIYENEELRLRTININAEVERGQSDIRKLRRENEQLRREIWSLRDEYDRLNKRFKSSKYLTDSISEHGQSESNSEDSDSCDTCRGEGNINDDCDHLTSSTDHEHLERRSDDGSYTYRDDVNVIMTTAEPNKNGNTGRSREHMHVNFDHLSIVSEENLSASEGIVGQQSVQDEHNRLSEHNNYNYIEKSESASSLPTLMSPLTPITPIEIVANQVNDLQSIIPPLSYFENIIQHNMASSISSNTSANTFETAIQSNGWDYNIQSPFMNRQCQTSEHSLSTSTSTTMSLSHLLNQSQLLSSNEHVQKEPNKNPVVSTSNTTQRNPKHFFSPIKPRLKLDTSVAIKTVATVPYLENMYQNSDSPDIYVNNALAAPYHPQPLPVFSLPSDSVSSGHQSLTQPIYVTAQKESESSVQNSIADDNSKDPVNIDQILTELGIISEDILHMQLNKSKSQEKLNTGTKVTQYQFGTAWDEIRAPYFTTATTHTQAATSITIPKCQHMSIAKNRKPHRSEINLVLSYNGANPVKIPLAENATTGALPLANEDPGALLNDESIGIRESNSPSPPQPPDPMDPFPSNPIYLGFEQINKPLKTEPLSLNMYTAQQISSPPTPPPPPHLLSFSVESNKTSNKDKYHETNTAQKRDHNTLNTDLTISSPDLSILPSNSSSYAAMASVKCRRFARQYDSGSCVDITRLLEANDDASITTRHGHHRGASDTVKDKPILQTSVNETSSYESSSGSEITKQKSSRRVSIACHDPFDQNQQVKMRTSSASVNKLDDMIPSLVLNIKHAHSTPNSPHSSRRRGVNISSTASTNNSSSTLHRHGHHHHHHHQHTRKPSQESITDARDATVSNSNVNSNQDSILSATPQHATRYKCLRRHSEGTLMSSAGDRSGMGIGSSTGMRVSGISGQHHNHHHHHHHRRDSNQETGTSMSERNSGSMVSSRESSTSLSTRSQRRKISVSSHTGGKIPWCGCWGNGCL